MPDGHAKGLEQSWKGWVVDVDVHLNRDGEEPPFYLETYLPKSKDGEICFHNNDRPGFLIRFNLLDPHHTGYLFPNDTDEALYSAKGAGCPTSKGQWGQFTAVGVENGNTTLVVKNLNQSGHEGAFGYTLRVTKGGDWKNLDPGGLNQNGLSSRI